MSKINPFKGLRDFLILWSSQFVSSLGTAMTNFALIVWVYGREGTASSITLLSVFSLLPSILFSFIAGTIADRWDKKRTMLMTDAFAALGTVVVFSLYLSNSEVLWLIMFLNRLWQATRLYSAFCRSFSAREAVGYLRYLLYRWSYRDYYKFSMLKKSCLSDSKRESVTNLPKNLILSCLMSILANLHFSCQIALTEQAILNKLK